MTRRIISLVIALCLTGFGAAALIYLFVFAAGFKVFMVLGAGFVLTAGAVWLYADFIDATPNE